MQSTGKIEVQRHKDVLSEFKRRSKIRPRPPVAEEYVKITIEPNTDTEELDE